jgi:hypothetical protein
MRVACFHPTTDEVLWPGIWNPAWEREAEDLYSQPGQALLKEAGDGTGLRLRCILYPAGLTGTPRYRQALALTGGDHLRPKLVEVGFPGCGAVPHEGDSWRRVARTGESECVQLPADLQ